MHSQGTHPTLLQACNVAPKVSEVLKARGGEGGKGGKGREGRTKSIMIAATARGKGKELN